MAKSLKGRLARLRELGLSRATEIGRAGAGGSVRDFEAASRRAAARSPRVARKIGGTTPPSFLAGWDQVAEFVWSRRIFFEDRLPAYLDGAPFHPASARGGSAEIPSHELRFFDLETTGLSGGSGTVAFLAAIGRREEGSFAVRQLFLEDYPGEPAFLDALLAELEPSATVVTYNGRSFDLPLLRTRCVMNGMIPPARSDIDLLFAARRLWRRVHGGASLGLLEREVLGIERELDIPGSMIPELWLSFLRTGDAPSMPAAMSHNADDVASLARLLARAARLFVSPRDHAASSAVDRAGLGRTLLAVGRLAEGEELLEAALGDGDEAAGLTLSRNYRRAGRVEERRRVLGMLPASFASYVERAKFVEHVERDPGAALELALRAETLAKKAEEREAIARRLARLGRKAGRDRRGRDRL